MNNFFQESLYKSMLKLKSLSLVKKNSNSYLHILSTEWNVYFFGFFSSQKSYFWNNLCRGKKRQSNSKSFSINICNYYAGNVPPASGRPGSLVSFGSVLGSGIFVSSRRFMAFSSQMSGFSLIRFVLSATTGSGWPYSGGFPVGS